MKFDAVRQSLATVLRQQHCRCFEAGWLPQAAPANLLLDHWLVCNLWLDVDGEQSDPVAALRQLNYPLETESQFFKQRG
jgi:hypothetical protein